VHFKIDQILEPSIHDVNYGKIPNKNKFRDLGDMIKYQQALQDCLIPGGKYKNLFSKDIAAMPPPPLQ
jgi:hypothetical protein